jgi:DNA-directed RNA polymerase beta' subunit
VGANNDRISQEYEENLFRIVRQSRKKERHSKTCNVAQHVVDKSFVFNYAQKGLSIQILRMMGGRGVITTQLKSCRSASENVIP